MTPPGGGAVLVVNPRATRATPSLVRRLEEALAPLGLRETVVARSAAETRAVAARARAEGRAVVVVVGGDGTVQAVADVLQGGPTALLPVAGGSTNVLARGLGWPARADDALPLLGPAVAAGPVDIRLARIRLDDGPERTMCVNAGIGVDAETVRWVEDHPSVKRRLRQGAFAAAVAGPGVRALLRGPELGLREGDAPPVRCGAVLVACGRPYTYVRSWALDVLPRADWDGRLEWFAVPRRALLTAGRAALAGIRGRPPGGRRAMGGLAADEVRVTAAEPVAVQADGEALGRAREVRIRPGDTLRVVLPADAPRRARVAHRGG